MSQIAIGIGENKDVIKACEIFQQENPNFILNLIDDEFKLINAFSDDSIDAVLRGSLPSNKIIKEIKTLAGCKYIQRATYVNGDGKEFLLSPVGIDEGESIIEKYKLTLRCASFIEKLGKKPKIAILANGRKGDYGRSPQIDSSIDESEALFNLIVENTDFDVKNYYILIEQAISDNTNIIIAPNGIMGNIIFRTLILISKWPSYGAITFGTDKIYIDTSRDQTVEVYLRSLNLIKKLLND